jgi:hypothetical protein
VIGPLGRLSEIKSETRDSASLASPLHTPQESTAMERIHITQHSSLGAAWFVGWLFTIGYLHLDFWWGLLGLVVWPYFLGSHFATPAI